MPTKPEVYLHGIKRYDIDPAHDLAVAAHNLRHAIREVYNAELTPDVVGLGTLANIADVLADGLNRHWWTVRPTLDEEANDAR